MNDKIETVDEILNRLKAYDDIKRERDEFRKERDQFRSLNESYAACWEEIRAALSEREQGDKTCDLDRVLKAIRERDELQEKYDQIYSQTLFEINKVCDERDKLREVLREILKVSEPTPVLTYQKMEDIASKALKETK